MPPDVHPITLDNRTIHCLILGYSPPRPAITSGPSSTWRDSEPEEIDWMLCTKDGTELLPQYCFDEDTQRTIKRLLSVRLNKWAADEAADAAIESYRSFHGV